GLAGVRIEITDIDIVHGHPSSLPPEKLAVYVFMDGDCCIKVGMIGRANRSRYCKAHYNPRRKQGLAFRLVKEGYQPPDGSLLTEYTVESWLRDKTDRINFLIPKAFGPRLVALFEAFVQCRLKP